MHTSDLNFYRPGVQPVHLAPGFRAKIKESCDGSIPNPADKTGQDDFRCGNPVEGDDYLCASCRKEAGEA